MLIKFDETFSKPIDDVFPYFKDPASWVKLYGEAAPVAVAADGWTTIPLQKFPFPLKARLAHSEPGQKVMWVFDGFWRGIAQIEFQSSIDAEGTSRTRVFGFEYIVPFGFWFAEHWIAKTFMQKEFERIWALGWRRLSR